MQLLLNLKNAVYNRKAATRTIPTKRFFFCSLYRNTSVLGKEKYFLCMQSQCLTIEQRKRPIGTVTELILIIMGINCM